MENEELKEPKIGEVVAIPIKNLGIPRIINLNYERYYINEPKKNVIDKFQYWFHIYRYNECSASTNVELEDYKFKDDNLDKYITLLRYEENGIFKELYTNEKMAFRIRNFNDAKNLKFTSNYIFDDKYVENADINCANFLECYEEIKEVPLSIDMWYPLTDEVKSRIFCQEQESDKLKEFIFYLMQYARHNLEEIKKQTVVDDFDVAHGENIIYDFIHNSNLATANQSDEEKEYELEPKRPWVRQLKA